MPLPTPYNSQQSAIASYNYSDLAENTGIKLFYGAKTASSGAATYILSQNQIYSKSISVGFGGGVLTNPTQVTDIDFDLTPFNAPQSIRGTILFNYFQKYHADSGTCSGATLIKLRKWDGTTETEIAEVWSDPSTIIDATHGYNFAAIPLTIPKTPFKKGEQLRVTVQQWCQSPAAAAEMTMGIDPMNRDAGAGDGNINPSTDTPTSTTQFKVWIPFDLDL